MSERGDLPVSAGDERSPTAAHGPVIETSVRVRFAETDAMGVVYHTNYIVWFEVGRGAYWRALCRGVSGMPQDAGSFPVSDVQARFHAPARYGDVVVIRTWVSAVRSRSITFGYECALEDSGRRLATGQTTHLFLDAEGRASRLPDSIRRAMAGSSSPEAIP